MKESVLLNLLWVMFATILVMGMQIGFALLEAGSARMKNAAHVAGKQMISFAIATLSFWAIGFGVAFGKGNALLGTEGWFMHGDSMSTAGVPIASTFLFQLSFAGVSLAIVWGGFAERAKLSLYFLFGAFYMIAIYPVVGHWVFGGGWLAAWGMQDFAGSTVVHLQGAVAACVASVLLGPRKGKFNRDGTVNVLPGHNQVYTVIGGFILWIGWIGFNAGSTLSVKDGFFAYVTFTTMLASSAGAVVAVGLSLLHGRKADIPTMVNGVIASLVAITAACAFVEPWAAVIIGGVASAIAYWTAIVVERRGLDDPIFACSVHGIAGVVGTLLTGVFAAPRLVEKVGVGQMGLIYGGGIHQMVVQLAGIGATILYAGGVSWFVLSVLKRWMGLRVQEREEVSGLDLSEHGAYGYPEHIAFMKEEKRKRA
ncbi:ammonium transporter [Fictibacillus macauensis ZFHKF-1]|uniref:Ammonium transporter n=1 Tax=Fictibacillus macauensis ZFHKF-1 TaxID=1196324 RepID=I8J4U6_9BACL|nr:ammonium transporter [Fictibacillus macauensis ZFHKF-1]